MFTGLIEEIGQVKNIKKSHDLIKLIISADKIMNNIQDGDSIAVNGVCLTVTSCLNGEFDVMPETTRVTNLSKLKNGDLVNLERALKVGERFGGHIVSGHIDGVGVIDKIKKSSQVLEFIIKARENIMQNIVYKGSITVDGVSLTCAEAGENFFKFYLIPHTQEKTILSYKKEGDIVNLECDIIGKYVRKIVSEMENVKKNSITESFLKENGFI